MTYYVTVNSDPDAWGTNTDGFDCEAEAEKIRDAAETAGLDVYEYDDRPRDDVENTHIQWFEEWCSAGYEWDEATWAAWFAKQIPQDNDEDE